MRREVRAHGIAGSIREDFLRRRAVQIDGWNSVSLSGSRVEDLEPLDGHGMDCMCNGLVKVLRETNRTQELSAVERG